MHRKWITLLCMIGLFFTNISPSHVYSNTFKKVILQLEKISPQTQAALLENEISATKIQLKTYLLKRDKDITFRTLGECKGLCNSISFSPDGKFLATGGMSHAKIWRAKTWEGHPLYTNNTTAISFSPDSKYFLLGSYNGTLSLYSVYSGKRVKTIIGDWYNVRNTTFSPDSRYLFFTSLHHTIHIWDVKKDRELKTIKNDCPIISLSVHPSGKYLAATLSNHQVKIWGTDRWNVLKTWSLNPNTLFPASFSADGRYFVYGSVNGMVKIWDIGNGFHIFRTLNLNELNEQKVSCVAFSPDGRYLFSGGHIRTDNQDTNINHIQIWEVATKKLLRSINVREGGQISSITISPNFRYLAVCYTNEGKDSVLIWDIFDREDREVLSILQNTKFDLDAQQKFLLYALSRSKSQQNNLSEMERKLKKKYGQPIPELLDLKASYESLTPEFKRCVKECFNVVAS